MSLQFNGSSSKLVLSSGSLAALASYPCTIAAWIKPNSQSQGCVVGIAGPSTSGYFGIAADDQWGIGMCGIAGNGAASWKDDAVLDSANWQLLVMVFTDANNRRCYYKSVGGHAYTDNFNLNMSGLNALEIGTRNNVGWYSGLIAHVAVWTSALSGSDVASLAGGAVPSSVQSGTLLDYWALVTQASTHTGVNGRVLTASNTVESASNPSVSGADTTPPTQTGTITVTNNTTGTSYTLTWPAGSDNVAVTSYERSLDGGTTWTDVGNVLTVNITGRTPGATDAVRVRAKDAAGNVSTPALSTSVVLPDTVVPTLTGTITVSALTSTSYTLAWPAGSDNVAVTSYERSLDGGTTWTDVGNVLTVNISGRTPSTTDNVRVRAKDAAGNVSTPALSATVNLPAGASGTITTDPIKNWSGALQASATIQNVVVLTLGRTLALSLSNQTTSAGGVLTIASGSLTAGTQYMVGLWNTDGSVRGLKRYTAA